MRKLAICLLVLGLAVARCGGGGGGEKEDTGSAPEDALVEDVGDTGPTTTDVVGTDLPVDKDAPDKPDVPTRDVQPGEDIQTVDIPADVPTVACTPENAEETCDDSDPCTIDTCTAEGTCARAAKDCEPDDKNPCHEYYCEPETGACKTRENVFCCPCESDLGLCEDDNPCTIDACETNQPDLLNCCAHTASAAGCDDGNACTSGDACAPDPILVGVCEPGDALVCPDDGNPETAEVCLPAEGCKSIALVACPGGQTDCPAQESCTRFVCDLDETNPLCQPEPAEGACSDGNACTQNDQCVQGVCRGNGAVNCDDSDPCTRDSCAPATGCQNETIENCCLCAVDGDCSEGSCPSLFALTVEGCAELFCKPDGRCGTRNVPNETQCQNADLCTLPDQCFNGACVDGNLRNCDDGLDTTEDYCTMEECAKDTLRSDFPCCHDEIGNLCNEGVVCESGTDCDDGDACTRDSCLTYLETPTCTCDPIPVCDCDPDSGDGGAAACDDGQPCTADTCVRQEAGGLHKGVCDHEYNPSLCCEDPCDTATDCADADTCTLDLCEPGVGGTLCCTHPIIPPPCGVDCTTDDQCRDNDPCTLDKCGPDGKCLPSTQSPDCCTNDEDCPDDPSPCIDATCVAGSCQAVFNNAVCTDGDNCTTEDHCNGGECVGIDLVCDDNNECTSDRCDEDEGCVYERILPAPPECPSCATAADCDDDQVCTRDTCTPSGQCLHEDRAAPACIPVHCRDETDCDDGNPCTNDVCEGVGVEGAAHACVHTELANCTPPASLECESVDNCIPTACQPDSPMAYCQTDPTCVQAHCTDVGCRFTLTVACASGECTPTTQAVDCYDGSPCTVDICDPATLTCLPNEERPSAYPEGDAIGACVECSDTRPCDREGTEDDPGISLGLREDPCVELRCVLPASVPEEEPMVGYCVADTTRHPNRCEDYDLCTTDACTEAGCEHAPVGANCEFCYSDNDCDDFNQCTEDKCGEEDEPFGFFCTHTAIPDCLPCSERSDCPNVDDFCTAYDCQRGRCVRRNFAADPNFPASCDPPPGGTCTATDDGCDDLDDLTVDACMLHTNPANNKCMSIPQGACESDDQCVSLTACRIGRCVGGACQTDAVAGCTPRACTDWKACDDQDALTFDTCANGYCIHVPSGAVCESQSQCRLDPTVRGDSCAVYGCVLDGSCIYVGFPDSVRCGGNSGPRLPAGAGGQPIPCTGDDDCGRSMRMDETSDPVACEEGEGATCFTHCVGDACYDWSCTTGRCNLETGGCVFFDGDCKGCDANADCEDGDPCTTDTCNAGDCVHTAVTPCTPRACSPTNRCPTTSFCELGLCLSGECVYVPNPYCD